MIEIGRQLREAREKNNLTIEQVEEMTRIREKYIRAIENGDFYLIPEEVYLKGFIRSLANCVGLDGNMMVRQYNELCKINEALIQKKREEEDIAKAEQNKRELEETSAKAGFKPGMWIWILATFVLVLVKWFLVPRI